MTEETGDQEYTARFIDSNTDITVRHNEVVLAAAVRAGVNVSYGCNNGNCGECKARLQSGRVRAIRAHDYAFTEKEKAESHFLMCACAPRSDLSIIANLSNRQQPRSLRAQIRKLTQPATTAPMMVTIRPQRSSRLRFMAGQYVRVSFADYAPIECSVASCPCDERHMELHVFPSPDTDFRQWLFHHARVGLWVDVTGPFGEFVFSGDTERPVLAITHTLGFAPIKSILEHITAQESELPIHLYRVAEPTYPHYLENLCRSWDDALDQLRVTNLSATDNPIPRILRDPHRPGHLNDYDIYISAPATQYKQWQHALIAAGARPERVFVETSRGTEPLSDNPDVGHPARHRKHNEQNNRMMVS